MRERVRQRAVPCPGDSSNAHKKQVKAKPWQEPGACSRSPMWLDGTTNPFHLQSFLYCFPITVSFTHECKMFSECSRRKKSLLHLHKRLVLLFPSFPKFQVSLYSLFNMKNFLLHLFYISGSSYEMS